MVERSLSMREVRGSMPRFSNVPVLKHLPEAVVVSERHRFRTKRGYRRPFSRRTRTNLQALRTLSSRNDSTQTAVGFIIEKLEQWESVGFACQGSGVRVWVLPPKLFFWQVFPIQLHRGGNVPWQKRTYCKAPSPHQ